MKNTTLKVIAFLVVCAIATVTHAQTGGSWTNPGSNPPQGNVLAPIHVGETAQTKAGILGVSGITGAFRLFDRVTPTDSWAWYASRDTNSASSWLRLFNYQDSRDQITVDRTGMRLFGNLWAGGLVTRDLQVTGGQPAVGKVLGAVDTNGTVAWVDAATTTVDVSPEPSFASLIYTKRIQSTATGVYDTQRFTPVLTYDLPNKLYVDNPGDIILSCGGATTDQMSWSTAVGTTGRDGNASDQSLWYLHPVYPAAGSTELPYCTCGQNDPNEEDRFTHGCGFITGVFLRAQSN